MIYFIILKELLASKIKTLDEGLISDLKLGPLSDLVKVLNKCIYY